MHPETPQTESGASAPKLVPFGKYLLLERVAVGGMAEVWLAKRVEGEGVSELLAVKRILPNLSADGEFIKMFVDEARIAGQLQHPGIVPMQELGRIGQTFYIAMEHVWGQATCSRSSGRPSSVRARSIPFSARATFVAARVCEALDYAHVKRRRAAASPSSSCTATSRRRTCSCRFDGQGEAHRLRHREGRKRARRRPSSWLRSRARSGT
jgi:serine/threonine protein kinase